MLGLSVMDEITIGRDPACRIVIDDKSVSRWHGKIEPKSDGTYLISDTTSSGGSFVRVKGGWRRFVRAKVRAEDEVRLGEYVITVGNLMKEAKSAASKVKVKRNPATGEIIKS
jgi:predicted component of type VI protein secretion system